MANELEKSIASLIDGQRRIVWAIEGIGDAGLLEQAARKLNDADNSLMLSVQLKREGAGQSSD